MSQMKSGIYQVVSMQDYDEMMGEGSSPAMREVASGIFFRAGRVGQDPRMFVVVPEQVGDMRKALEEIANPPRCFCDGRVTCCEGRGVRAGRIARKVLGLEGDPP